MLQMEATNISNGQNGNGSFNKIDRSNEIKYKIKVI